MISTIASLSGCCHASLPGDAGCVIWRGYGGAQYSGSIDRADLIHHNRVLNAVMDTACGAKVPA